jgi:antitoxin StbD
VSDQTGQTLAILNRNKPAFYVVPPDVYEAMLDELDDARIAPIVRERMAGDQRVKMTIDRL